MPRGMARFHETRLAAGVPRKAQAQQLTSAATRKLQKVELLIHLLVISGAAV